MTCTSVIIAGAGPVGLFLACELAMRNISVLVLERDTTTSLIKESLLGRRGLLCPAIESFYRRGSLEQVLTPGERAHYIEQKPGFTFGGHFAGLMVNVNQVNFSTSTWKHHLPSPTFLPGRITIARMEKALADRAEELGAKILRGREVTGVSVNGETVTVYSGDEEYTAAYLVGCDGGRSTVRKAAGFEFEGTSSEFTGYAAICDIDNPELLKKGFNQIDKGMYSFSDGGLIHIVDFTPFDRTKTITIDYFQDALRRVSGTYVTVTKLHQSTSFTDRSIQASQYRRGRVFLAGDSAHIHSPLGAQGLTTGIADAINLGWKLTLAIKGTAPEGLLDTYEFESYPEAAAVLEWTRAQVVTLRADPYGKAVRHLIQDMIRTDEGATYFASRMWGVHVTQ